MKTAETIRYMQYIKKNREIENKSGNTWIYLTQKKVREEWWGTKI